MRYFPSGNWTFSPREIRCRRNSRIGGRVKLTSLLIALLVPLTWGVSGFFGGLKEIEDAKRGAPSSGFEGAILIGLGYVVWSVIALSFSGGKVLSGIHWHWQAITFALTFSLGGVTFALAMKYAESPTTVVAYSALYPAVTAVMTFFFLSDPMPLRKIAGIIFAVLAGILLA